MSDEACPVHTPSWHRVFSQAKNEQMFLSAFEDSRPILCNCASLYPFSAHSCIPMCITAAGCTHVSHLVRFGGQKREQHLSLFHGRFVRHGGQIRELYFSLFGGHLVHETEKKKTVRCEGLERDLYFSLFGGHLVEARRPKR